jgi:adenylate cyclase
LSVVEHRGRLFKTTGDGFLIEFASPVEAVRCAMAVQSALVSKQPHDPSPALELRIGINLGDVIVEEDGDVYGDGVNVAARLEQLADRGSIWISGTIYDQIEGKIDASFEYQGEHQVKNITRPVRVYRLAGASSAALRPVLPIPNKPSIAVLPFDNMGDDRNDEFLADGIVEDIIAALSRVRSFFVIARNSTFTYKGHAVNVQQVSRELGVRYVLEGSVRRGGDRVRVTSQLVDATTGAHLWADHYDGTTDDVFDFQDRITASVVGAIQPSIRSAEIERARRKRPDSLDAYDLVMRALPHVWSLDSASNAMATELLDEALRLDPNYPLALALSSWCSGQRVVYNWSSDIATDKHVAVTKAQTAGVLAPDDPFVLTALGAGLTISREYKGATHAIEKALALDPNSAWTWNRSGWLRVYLDDAETSIDHFNRAIRLSPFDPLVISGYAGIAAAHFSAGRYETSAEWFEKATHANPKAFWLYRGYAAALAFSGRQQEAEACVGKLLAAYPGLNLRKLKEALAFNHEFVSRYLEALRRCGLPE